MRSITALGVVATMMLAVGGCSSPPTSSAVAEGTPNHTMQWHGPVKYITTMGMKEALFDPVESPGTYYKLTSNNYVPGSSDAPPMTLTPYVGSTIMVTFQKEGAGLLWGAVVAKQ